MLQEIVLLTKDLIRFKSTPSNPQGIIECSDFIEQYLKTHQVVYQRIENEGIPSIVALPQEGFAPVLLMSHFDVVAGPENLFKPQIIGDRLFGRGSIDDKYAVALSLVLFKNYWERLRKQQLSQKDMPFGIILTGDEEIGGEKGAREVLKKIKGEFCIALDGGLVETIIVREKGFLRLKLISEGKSAHGARPWLGENAIEILIKDYLAVKDLFPENTPDHWHKTINLGLLRGGEAHNQVPDYAEAVLDIRFTEKDNPDDLIKQIKAIIKGKLVIEGKGTFFAGVESPYLKLLLEIAKNTTTGFEHGASDARFLANYGINGIVWGADGDQSAHALDEHVNLDSVLRLYGILEQFFEKIGKAKSIF